MSRARELARTLAVRVFGDRPAPVGEVARERRLLQAALADRPVGRVLVVGPGTAARQALAPAGVVVDVAGTVPLPEVTVCSAVDEAGSLPPARWDTVVVSDPGDDLLGRLRAVVPACRAGAIVLVVDRGQWPAGSPEADALRRVAAAPVTTRGRHRVWAAEVGP